MTDLRTFDDIGPDDVHAVGGKGLSLGRMASAGLPVPPGFCVTTAAYRRCHGQPLTSSVDLTEHIKNAYQQLGGGAVAVRSSATAEDGTTTSFAGQQETILGVRGDDAVCDAVARCWASLHTERAIAYRRKQGVSDDGLAMAVVVQRLIDAEVAGVLFTRDPLDPAGRRMLVEASWGLGESVVSGRVTPDRFHLDHDTGALLEQHINAKTTMVTADGETAVPAGKQQQACLEAPQLRELAELGRKVEAFYGAARDVEWAWAAGRFWLLQARPITVADAAEREKVRREEMALLAAQAEPGGTVWSHFNLSEILPEPTPMTWAIVRAFMSGKGGFGLMYRDLGYDPDPSLDDDGIFDLVCGRPYCNLSREARMHYRQMPFDHSFKALKKNPARALSPVPTINPFKAAWQFWLLLPVTLPVVMWKMARAESHRQEMCKTFAQRLREQLIPAFIQETDADLQQDISKLNPPALLERLRHWIKRTLNDFARDSLKPTALAALPMSRLEQTLSMSLGVDGAQAAVRDLMMGVHPDADADLAGAVRDLAAGKLDRATFLDRFGHRGKQEMELANPRWSEDEASGLGTRSVERGTETPHAESRAPSSETWDRIANEAHMIPALKTVLKAELDTLHLYLGLRETGKHYLMKGYALIRRYLVELDRRFHLHDGIFYLTPDELPALLDGKDFTSLIAERRRRRSLVLSLEVPQVLFSDDLEAIGRPVVLEGADTLQGAPLSAGVAEAPALVLEQPITTGLPTEPYILVCPSTDPAWVPLFVHAKGLVMETGGVLSHGAIVAREFGLPAVAGLSGIQRQLKTGQRLRVDGGRGTVTILPGEPVSLPGPIL
jgi:rifampicin phosphotransferase